MKIRQITLLCVYLLLSMSFIGNLIPSDTLFTPIVNEGTASTLRSFPKQAYSFYPFLLMGGTAFDPELKDETDVHFDAGTFYQTQRVGTGTAAYVRLAYSSEQTFTSSKTGPQARISTGEPNTPKGAGSFEDVWPGNERHSIAKFDLSSIPDGALITSAKVYVMIRSGYPTGTWGVHYSSNDGWNEATITWNNAPSYGGAITSVSMSRVEVYYAFDVTNTVKSDFDGGGNWVTFRWGPSGTATHTEFYGRNRNSAKAPYIVVKYKVFKASGTFISRVLDAGADISEWGQISWTETQPAGCELKYQIRASTSSPPTVSFEGPTGTDDYFTINTGQDIPTKWDGMRYVQYKGYFSIDSPYTDELKQHDVTFSYITGQIYERGVSQTFSFSWISSKTIEFSRGVVKSISFSLIVSRLGEWFKNTAQTLATIFSIVRIQELQKSVFQSMSLSLLSSRISEWFKNIAQNISTVFSVTRLLELSKSTSQGVDISFTVTKTQELFKTMSQSLTVSFFASRIYEVIKSVSGSMSTTLNVSRLQELFKSVSQALSMSREVAIEVFKDVSQGIDISWLLSYLYTPKTGGGYIPWTVFAYQIQPVVFQPELFKDVLWKNIGTAWIKLIVFLDDESKTSADITIYYKVYPIDSDDVICSGSKTFTIENGKIYTIEMSFELPIDYKSLNKKYRVEIWFVYGREISIPSVHEFSIDLFFVYIEIGLIASIVIVLVTIYLVRRKYEVEIEVEAEEEKGPLARLK